MEEEKMEVTYSTKSGKIEIKGDGNYAKIYFTLQPSSINNVDVLLDRRKLEDLKKVLDKFLEKMTKLESL